MRAAKRKGESPELRAESQTAAPITATPSADIVRALQVAHDALTDCVKHLMQRGPAPCPSFMATATGAVSRALIAVRQGRTPAVIQVESAFAACRSIRFAGDNAVRHGGEYNLTDLLAADRLAREALNPTMTEAFIDHAAKLILKKHRAGNRAKKGGAK